MSKNQRHCSSLPVNRISIPFETLIERTSNVLTWDHGQAVTHGSHIGTRSSCAELGPRVDVFDLRKTEGPHILTDNRDVFPSESLETLAGDVAERRGKVNQVDMREERVDGEEGRHGFNVVSIVSVKIGDLEARPFSMLTLCHHPSKQLVSFFKRSNGKNLTSTHTASPCRRALLSTLCFN